jgi:hypothetical protein
MGGVDHTKFAPECLAAALPCSIRRNGCRRRLLRLEQALQTQFLEIELRFDTMQDRIVDLAVAMQAE